MLNLPYVTKDLLGVGGKIRKTPSNFMVEELPLYPTSGEGQHLYLNLTREDQTTKSLQHQLATLFDIRDFDVGFAGLKDKNARSTQTFSIPTKRLSGDVVNDVVSIIQSNLQVEVNWARLHYNKIKVGHLTGNRFTIIISDLELPVEEAEKRANTILTVLLKRGLPNYFGSQRFGYQGENVRRGLSLILGETYIHDPWLRRFLVNSYQSHLCNRYLALRLEKSLFTRILNGDIAKKYAGGGVFQVEHTEIEQQRYDNLEISFTAPIFGYETWIATGSAGELEQTILEESNISLKLFRKLKAKGTRRMGRLLLQDVNVSASQEMLILSFTLPKGAFATTVLREIMKEETTMPERDNFDNNKTSITN